MHGWCPAPVTNHHNRIVGSSAFRKRRAHSHDCSQPGLHQQLAIHQQATLQQERAGRRSCKPRSAEREAPTTGDHQQITPCHGPTNLTDDGMIDVIGTDAGAPASLPAPQQTLLRAATVIAAPQRLQAALQDWLGTPSPSCSAAMTRGLWWTACNQGRLIRLVVLASGDPLWFGLGRILCDRIGAERLRFHPAPTSLQLAFSHRAPLAGRRLGEPARTGPRNPGQHPAEATGGPGGADGPEPGGAAPCSR